MRWPANVLPGASSAITSSGYTARLGGRPVRVRLPARQRRLSARRGCRARRPPAPAPPDPGGNSWFGTASTVIPAARRRGCRCGSPRPRRPRPGRRRRAARPPRTRPARACRARPPRRRPTPGSGRRARGLHEQLDHLAVGGRREPERPARRHALDRLLRAGQPRQPLRGSPRAARSTTASEISSGVEVDAQLVAHVARPLQRAHAEHVARRGVLPAAAALGDQLAAGAVPGGLGVQQEAVEVEDDGGDGRRSSGGPGNRTPTCGFGDRHPSRWTSPPSRRQIVQPPPVPVDRAPATAGALALERDGLRGGRLAAPPLGANVTLSVSLTLRLRASARRAALPNFSVIVRLPALTGFLAALATVLPLRVAVADSLPAAGTVDGDLQALAQGVLSLLGETAIAIVEPAGPPVPPPPPPCDGRAAGRRPGPSRAACRRGSRAAASASRRRSCSRRRSPARSRRGCRRRPRQRDAVAVGRERRDAELAAGRAAVAVADDRVGRRVVVAVAERRRERRRRE